MDNADVINTNIHAAATGRFAAAEEIIQNFYCEPYNESYELHNGDKRAKKFGFRNLLLYAFLTFVLILLLMPFQRINSINFPFFIFKDFIVILLLSVFLIYKNQKDKYKTNRNKYISKVPYYTNNQLIHSADALSDYAEDYAEINYFRLGILDADNYYNSYSEYNNYNHNYNNNNDNCNDKNKNRLIIGIDRKKRFEHIMIVSPTGGGKTSKYIIPSIRKDACFKNTCVYAIDIDGPYLYNAVKDSWLANNKKIVHFDPYNADSVHFNPLIERCGDENNFYNNEIRPVSDDKLYELSSMIFYADNNELKGGDIQAHKYYSKRSADILYGCLLYLKCKYDIKYFNLITAKKFFEKGFSFIEKEIKSYDGNNSKKIKEVFNNFFEIPFYERAKIITDILNGLDFIKNANVENAFKTTEKVLSSGNFLTIKDLFNKNNDTLLIVSVPKEKINSGGSRLISIITDMVIKEIYENRREVLKSEVLKNNSALNGNYNDDNERSGKENIKAGINSGEKAKNNYNDFIYKDIFIYLDEFPVLNINNFDIELANLRKTGTGVCISLQDISFLKNKYGDISLIDSNIGTHIIMGNAGIDTAKRYSERMGQKYVMHTEKFSTVSGGNFKNGIDGININSIAGKRRNNNLGNNSFGKYGGVNESGNSYGGGRHGSIYNKKLDDILAAVGLNNRRETPVASGLFPLMNADEIKNMDINDVLIYSKFTRPFILSLS
jgi:type IV secretory pathway TraG/TraD family ATPase VirD4